MVLTVGGVPPVRYSKLALGDPYHCLSSTTRVLGQTQTVDCLTTKWQYIQISASNSS